ncbi:MULTISPECIES: hypothetical protein [unclassified Lentimicrobium]|uniref:hypothetical protein n=1 Tax=unclassified Lentimicrobium TaxID=2677434 RepID=UPI001557D36B|nr:MULTISPECIES: hypothetical protein [unclassified Lentimicrobium]NPD43958.1 hypothetical protein [Lentimicrobium sp. S6]NPD84173.1 hypothetical protein [Lentimicrobium sp. L6]
MKDLEQINSALKKILETTKETTKEDEEKLNTINKDKFSLRKIKDKILNKKNSQ